MGTDEDKRLIEAFRLRLWGRGDVTPIDEVIDPDAVTHWGDFGSNTIEAVRADVERYYVGFTDVETRVDDLLADGDKVVLRWSTIGRQTVPYGRVASTVRAITMEGVDVYRIVAGRIVEAWSLWDGLSVYQQLGPVDADVGP